MSNPFQKATKTQAKLRLALQGPSGAGKTYTALSVAKHLGLRIAVVDTERGSASKYANLFDFDRVEVCDDYNPQRVVDMLSAAADAKYDVVICDSLTHFWNGQGGFLDLVDQECKRMIANGKKPDSFAAWKNLTPVYNRLIQAITGAPLHVIVTLRAKQEYEKTKDENGRTKIEKVGMAPEIRENFQYELDVEGMLDMDNNLAIGKTRCPTIKGKVFNKAGKELADHLLAWLTDGAPAPEAPPPAIDWKAKATAAKDILKSKDEEKARELWTKYAPGGQWQELAHELVKAGGVA